MIDVCSLCEASTRGDVKTVRNLLLARTSTAVPVPVSTSGTKKSPMISNGPDDTLLPSTDACKAVHNLLFGDDGSSATSCDGNRSGDVPEQIGKRKRAVSPAVSTSKEADGIPLLLTNSTSVISSQPEAILCALLMISPIYVTPWQAALDAVKCIQRQSGIVGRGCKDDAPEDGGASDRNSSSASVCKLTLEDALVREIGIFLNNVSFGKKAGAATNKGKDSRDALDSSEWSPPTQTGMMRQLAEQIIEPLLRGGNETSSTNSSDETNAKRHHAIAPLVLLPALFAAAERWEGPESTLVGSIVDKMFPSPSSRDSCLDVESGPSPGGEGHLIRPGMVLSLLKILPSLSTHMSPQHCLNVRRIVLDALKDVSFRDLPDLGESIVILAASTSGAANPPPDPEPGQVSAGEVSSADYVPTWTELILHLYKYCGDVDATSLDATWNQGERSSTERKPVLPAVESALSRVFQSFSSELLVSIIGSIRDVASELDVPCWVRSNVVLLIAHSCRSSGMSSLRQMVDQALAGSSKSRRSRDAVNKSDFATAAFDCLVGLSFRVDADGSGEEVELNLSELGEYLRGSSLETTLQHAPYEKLLSRLDHLVIESIFLGSRPGESCKLRRGEADKAFERALNDRADRFLKVATSFLDHANVSKPSSFQSIQRICLAMAICRAIFRCLDSLRYGCDDNEGNTTVMSAMAKGIFAHKPDRRYLYFLVLSAVVRKAVEGINRAMITRSPIDEETLRMESSFTFLTDLLSEKWCDADNQRHVLAEPLPLDIFRDLTYALCRTSYPMVRRSILDMADRLLRFPFNGYGGPSTDCGAEAVSVALEALCLLIRPCDAFRGSSPFTPTSIRDSCGIIALANISDLLISNSPALPLRVRRDLYQRLLTLVVDDELDEWTCSRLEGTALYRLLNHYCQAEHGDPSSSDPNSTPSLVFIPGRSFASWSLQGEDSTAELDGINQVEDLPSLVHLLVALITRRCDDGAGFKQEICSHLVGVLNERPSTEGDAEDAFAAASIWHEVCYPSMNDTVFPAAVLRLCLGAMAKRMVDPLRRVAANEDAQTQGCELASCTALQTGIAIVEKTAYGKAQREQIELKNTNGFLPRWTLTESVASNASAMVITNANVADDEGIPCLDAITPSLCGMFLGLLLDGSQMSPSNMSRALDLSNAVSVVLRKSSDAAAATTQSLIAESTDDGAPFGDVCAHSLTKNATRYLEISASAFSHVMSSSSSTNRASSNEKSLNMLLQGIERCCSCIEDMDANESSGLDVPVTVSSLWKVYAVMASESGSSRFIRFLDERLVRSKGAGLPDLMIESHDDIDELVRGTRIAVLSSLASVIKTFAIHCQGPATDMSLELLLSTVTVLSTDLYRGLHGKSGGITRNVFLAYLTAIDACVETVLSMGHEAIRIEIESSSNHKASLINAYAMCEISSIHLWNIPCKFCLDQEARTFKTTLDISLSGMQSVRRHIDFVLAYTAMDVRVDVHQRIDSVTIAANKCLNALRDGSSMSRSRKRASSKISEDESSRDESSDDSYESDDNESSFVDNSSQGTTKKALMAVWGSAPETTRMPIAFRNLQVNTPTAWSWTQTVVFVAIETNWMESQTIIKAKNLKPILHEGSELVPYVTHRHQELTASLSCATSFLERVNKSKAKDKDKESLRGDDISSSDANDEREAEGQNEKGVQDTIMAELLSSTTKLRFCSTLERVAVTLRAAIRFMLILVKDHQSPMTNECRKDLPKTDVRFAEALACYCAWASNSIDALSLTAGARRWYHNEKARYRVAKAKAKAAGRHFDQDPVVRRLPKCVYQMEELEVSFQKLADAILTLSKKKKSDANSAQFLTSFDKIMPDAEDLSSTTGSEWPQSFAKVLSTHRGKLASSESQLSSFDMALISFEDKQDDLSSGASLGKRKRRGGRNTDIEQHLRKAQRNILRSRNEVVDEWLDLDANNADRNSSLDAFVDLEDFLVEG